MKLTRKAHAKLNLFLEVTGKRASGYHELFSLAVFLDLADEITVQAADAITVTQSKGDSGIEDNIILKTALLLAKKYDVKSGAKITFVKNIPISGGLGGGSSDAATTLILLDKLWDLHLTHLEMYRLALELGTDVPVCLYSILESANAAIFRGIGEIIEPAPEIPRLFFTLVNPAVELSTARVFDNFKYEGLGYEPLHEKGGILKNISRRANDLEPAAIALVPEIGIALEDLATSKNCRLARMTGSGATSFGIFKTHRDARDAAVALIKKHPGWQIGAVGLKEVLTYGRLEKSMRAKTITARNFGLSTAVHVFVICFLGAFFIFQKYVVPQPKYITVSYGVEEPAYKPVIENDYAPAGGDTDEVIIESAPPVIEESTVIKKPPAHKPKPKKPPAKLRTIGSINGNTPKPAHPVPKDYLQLLQYTVQQRSVVPNYDPNLKGRAVLHLAFNRKGYVLAYALKQSTGSDILDKAAEKTAKRLMNDPFPPAPWNFDTGDEVLEYDFVISYPHH